MKKTLVTLALVAMASSAAFAQGKISVQTPVDANGNPSTGGVKLTSDTSRLAPADQAKAGQYVGNASPISVTLIAGMYIGTSSTSMALYSPRVGDTRGALLNNAASKAGVIPLTQYQANANATSYLLSGGATAAPAIGGGTSVFVRLAAWDAAYTDFASALAAGKYAGLGNLISGFALGSSVAYPNAAPQLNQDITVAMVPEPASAALVGMGLASLLIFRRRK